MWGEWCSMHLTSPLFASLGEPCLPGLHSPYISSSTVPAIKVFFCIINKNLPKMKLCLPGLHISVALYNHKRQRQVLRPEIFARQELQRLNITINNKFTKTGSTYNCSRCSLMRPSALCRKKKVLRWKLLKISLKVFSQPFPFTKSKETNRSDVSVDSESVIPGFPTIHPILPETHDDTILHSHDILHFSNVAENELFSNVATDQHWTNFKFPPISQIKPLFCAISSVQLSYWMLGFSFYDLKIFF